MPGYRRPALRAGLFGLIAAAWLTGCGTADKRLVAHTEAEPAPPLVATDDVVVPTPSGRYSLPAGVTPRSLDLETLKELERPPEMATTEAETLPAEDGESSDVELVDEQPPSLRMAGAYPRLWARLESALSAGGFSVRERSSDEGRLLVRYAEAGGDAAGTEGILYRLELERGDRDHRLWIRDAEGGPVPVETAKEVLTIIRDRL
ncbi:MAG: outer membrane protein assembly factor BamC [Pseudomonadota bacterium]